MTAYGKFIVQGRVSAVGKPARNEKKKSDGARPPLSSPVYLSGHVRPPDLCRDYRVKCRLHQLAYAGRYLIVTCHEIKIYSVTGGEK